ncbi:Ctr-domain-containing protein [Armillaria fumosa]|nr:Ctr-domain-containing protein [Armillaria fumosa]
MDMGSSSSSASGASCKISMMWNWTTVDACFISNQWHIRTVGAYVGTLIAIFAWVVVLEAFRRLSREYDRRIIMEWNSARTDVEAATHDSVKGLKGLTIMRFGNSNGEFQPTHTQQLVRSVFHTVQFGAGYMLMLLAMYYNGGIIFVIFVATFVGYFISGRDMSGGGSQSEGGKECCG